MDDITLTKFRDYVENKMGQEEWVSVIEFFDSGKEVDRGAYFSALIANDKVESVLKKYDWDLSIGSGRPGFSTKDSTR